MNCRGFYQLALLLMICLFFGLQGADGARALISKAVNTAMLISTRTQPFQQTVSKNLHNTLIQPRFQPPQQNLNPIKTFGNFASSQGSHFQHLHQQNLSRMYSQLSEHAAIKTFKELLQSLSTLRCRAFYFRGKRIFSHLDLADKNQWQAEALKQLPQCTGMAAKLPQEMDAMAVNLLNEVLLCSIGNPEMVETVQKVLMGKAETEIGTNAMEKITKYIHEYSKNEENGVNEEEDRDLAAANLAREIGKVLNADELFARQFVQKLREHQKIRQSQGHHNFITMNALLEVNKEMEKVSQDGERRKEAGDLEQEEEEEEKEDGEAEQEAAKRDA